MRVCQNCRTGERSKILERAERLAAFAARVWSEPVGLAEPESGSVSPGISLGPYTMDDHPYLGEGRLGRILFDALRVEVLALDPCVEEEFNKVYVAYKAETNFVDVVPLASGLNLFLNLEIHELVDHRGIAQDVSNVGHLDNGNVRVRFTNLGDLTPVMALVRQALEVQMGESGGPDRQIDKGPLLAVAD